MRDLAGVSIHPADLDHPSFKGVPRELLESRVDPRAPRIDDTPPARKVFDPKARGENALSAYYYTFEPTGVEAVDNVLAAVADAGKAFHNTMEWGEEPYDRTETCVESIERMAVDAAAVIANLERQVAAEQAKSKAILEAARELQIGVPDDGSQTMTLCSSEVDELEAAGEAARLVELGRRG